MIEEAAQPARVVTTDYERVPFLMTSCANSLHAGNSRHDFVTYSWIVSHCHISPVFVLGWDKIVPLPKNVRAGVGSRSVRRLGGVITLNVSVESFYFC